MNEWEEALKRYAESGQMDILYATCTNGTLLGSYLNTGHKLVFAVFEPGPGEQFIHGGLLAINPTAEKFNIDLSKNLFVKEPDKDASPESWVNFYNLSKQYKKRITWDNISQMSGISSGALRAKAWRMKKRNKP
jgi:hypothetical protein